jgi:hypothetical protein
MVAVQMVTAALPDPASRSQREQTPLAQSLHRMHSCSLAAAAHNVGHMAAHTYATLSLAHSCPPPPCAQPLDESKTQASSIHVNLKSPGLRWSHQVRRERVCQTRQHPIPPSFPPRDVQTCARESSLHCHSPRRACVSTHTASTWSHGRLQRRGLQRVRDRLHAGYAFHPILLSPTAQEKNAQLRKCVWPTKQASEPACHYSRP